MSANPHLGGYESANHPNTAPYNKRQSRQHMEEVISNTSNMFEGANRGIASSGMPVRSIIPPPFSSGINYDVPLASPSSNVAVTNEDNIFSSKDGQEDSLEAKGSEFVHHGSGTRRSYQVKVNTTTGNIPEEEL